MNDTPSADYRGKLTSPAFLAFLSTQFLGAVNDNMFRWLVVPIAKFKVVHRYKLSDEYEAIALGAGLACFVLPYLLFAPHAGWLADRFSKRAVIVGCKLAEIVIMGLGVAAILTGDIYLLFAVVALMGTQSALFSPSKMGIIPEIVRAEKISAANGVVGLTTVVAVIIGTVAGNYLYYVTGPEGVTEVWASSAALLGVAVVGWLVSFRIVRVPAANPVRAFPWNPAGQTVANLRLLGSDRVIVRVALGIAFFWSLASLAQLNVDKFAIDRLLLGQREVGPLLGVLAVGVGLGSVLAGLWSGGRVELGIVPLGSAVIAGSAIVLSTTGDSYRWTAVMLFFLGVGGGLFNVPLAAYLQHRSPRELRGAVLAATNFLVFGGMLLVSGIFPALYAGLKLDAPRVFLIAGLGTLPVAVYVFTLLPSATIRMVVWLLSHTVYRVRVSGRENLPETGGALLVANHVSLIDGILLILTSSRPIRMMARPDFAQSRVYNWLARVFRVIPVDVAAGPASLKRSLQEARRAVHEGELVCIFAEGRITRTGQMEQFRPGLMHIIRDAGAPVVPVYLHGLWGSIFSLRGGRLFWKRPARWPFPVTIVFGKPLSAPQDVTQVRQAVQTLGVQAVQATKDRQLIPPRLFLRKCRSRLTKEKIADSAGQEMTGGQLLAAVLVFRRILRRLVVQPGESMVGILLPPSVGATVANVSLTLSGKIAVNLNYTLDEKDLNYCVRQCEIRHVLTSRRFVEKRPLNVDAELVFVEDLKDRATALDKLIAAVEAYAVPVALLERLLGLTKVSPDDLLTVIFTSGSTGEPKGVMLSHLNVASNIETVDQLFHITGEDVVLGILPFFHSFGYTATLWLTMGLDPKAVFHVNPLDARSIGKLCQRHGVTITMATPTFLRGILKRCTPEQLQTLDLVVVGAEKLPRELADAFKEKFGIEPVEGYGTTELSPVAAFNVPAHRSGSGDASGMKPGTVGRPIPGTAVRIVEPETGRDVGTNCDGLLLVKGPNVMLGYLNQPEKTEEVLKDGWYNTGDIARLDDEGFIAITGRQSRFSKIGGEMVPHIKIEQLLNEIVGDADEGAEPKIAVTSVPDEKKGERLVVLHTRLDEPVDGIRRQLGERDVPNLWIPPRDSFVEVEEIPILGTGKLDLKAVKQLALQKCGQPMAGSRPD